MGLDSLLLRWLPITLVAALDLAIVLGLDAAFDLTAWPILLVVGIVFVGLVLPYLAQRGRLFPNPNGLTIPEYALALARFGLVLLPAALVVPF